MQNYKLLVLYMEYITESKEKGRANRLAFPNSDQSCSELLNPPVHLTG